MKLIKRYGAPDQNQIGSVNDLYVDLDTNEVYRCTGIKTAGEECGDATVYASTWGNTVYEWEDVGGGSLPILDEFDITWDGSTEGRDTLTLTAKLSDEPETFTYYKIAEPLSPYSVIGAQYYVINKYPDTIFRHSNLDYANGSAGFAIGANHDMVLINCTETNGVFWIDEYTSSRTFEADSPGLYAGCSLYYSTDRFERITKIEKYDPFVE